MVFHITQAPGLDPEILKSGPGTQDTLQSKSRDLGLPMVTNYLLVNIEKAIENGPVEIVDLPSYIAWWIFP